MNSLLGLEEALLRQTSTIEQAGYRWVNYLFLIVTAFSFLANSYFGYLLLRNWWGVVLLGTLMGYIHFSVLRIALITLMTKPIAEKKPVLTSTVPTALKRATHKLNIASVLRFIFVGLIAISICFPLTTFLFHKRAIEIEDVYRLNLASTVKAQSIGGMEELQHAYFPFVIFQQLYDSGSFKFILIVLFVAVYSPLLVLARLRYNNNNLYAELCRESMRQQVKIDYSETMEQSQYFLDKNYPSFDRKLTELTPFDDAPFNQVMKKGPARSYGSADDFRQFMRSR